MQLFSIIDKRLAPKQYYILSLSLFNSHDYYFWYLSKYYRTYTVIGKLLIAYIHYSRVFRGLNIFLLRLASSLKEFSNVDLTHTVIIT